MPFDIFMLKLKNITRKAPDEGKALKYENTKMLILFRVLNISGFSLVGCFARDYDIYMSI